MSEKLRQLQALETQLHEVNQEFSRADGSLYRMTDLDDEQRKSIGTQLRAVQSRWESVSRQISQAFGTDSATGDSRHNTTKADRDER